MKEQEIAAGNQLESNTPLGVSRGITLLGYYDSDITQGRLNELLSEAAPDTWIKQLLENSINRWHLNAWPRHWFSRIFSTDTNVDAWAAFRLFLRCVDSRFWIWHEQIKDASAVNPDFERRWQHIEINWETIRNRIRKNEDGFEKQLLELFLYKFRGRDESIPGMDQTHFLDQKFCGPFPECLAGLSGNNSIGPENSTEASMAVDMNVQIKDDSGNAVAIVEHFC